MKLKIVRAISHGVFYLTDEMKEYMMKLGMSKKETDFYYDIPRHHPILVKAVENCKDIGDLSITEIEGCKYYIEECEGIEIVKTPKDINWVIGDSKECKEEYPEEFV
jgi:hypothetical protein